LPSRRPTPGERFGDQAQLHYGAVVVADNRAALSGAVGVLGRSSAKQDQPPLAAIRLQSTSVHIDPTFTADARGECRSASSR
jgi:hypothetical protein